MTDDRPPWHPNCLCVCVGLDPVPDDGGLERLVWILRAVILAAWLLQRRRKHERG